ncbi:hypothetical protein E1301_Tti000716 [Triplophysa tibetana]|uniref:Uncharacterized protein n=1 Tax=Triplophysa tibetana TaxID=1572043 RepID=A0A5A9N7K9_9TELE|nr:hypothetical protein E1301_Tti000716 [Triplophysa tibetana]
MNRKDKNERKDLLCGETSVTIFFKFLAERNAGSPGRLQFQRVTMELFPSASAPCLIEQTYQCPFVDISYIRTLSATPQNRACSLCVSRYTVLPKTFQAVNKTTTDPSKLSTNLMPACQLYHAIERHRMDTGSALSAVENRSPIPSDLITMVTFDPGSPAHREAHAFIQPFSNGRGEELPRGKVRSLVAGLDVSLRLESWSQAGM